MSTLHLVLAQVDGGSVRVYLSYTFTGSDRWHLCTCLPQLYLYWLRYVGGGVCVHLSYTSCWLRYEVVVYVFTSVTSRAGSG